MSLGKGTRHLLQRLSASGSVLLVLLLDLLGQVPAWADGADAQGRAVLLVGRHRYRFAEDVDDLLEALKAGRIDPAQPPPGLPVVAYAPRASAALAEIAAGASREILVDGPRGTGKTQMTPAALAALAELHARAGHALPLKVLWVHDSLTSASAKTGRSIEQAHWAGLWSLRDDRKVAVLTVGGVEHVVADFVGAQDPTAKERLKAECHVVLAEEVIASLSEGIDPAGGVDEDSYALALTSARLKPNRRRVGVVVTNPGAPESWPARRFGLEGAVAKPGCVRCQIPAADRLSPEDIAEQIDSFWNDPEQQARLGLGEWVALQLGERVAVGYSPAMHVAAAPLVPVASHLLTIGWDGGHSPSAVIGQLIGGQVRVYAALNALKVGVLELIEDQVIPWLITHAPWARGSGMLTHVIDPSMKTPGQATIRESAERVIVETLRGRVAYGPVAWPPRREAVLRVLSPRLMGGQVGLQINPGADTELLRKSYAALWYYPQSTDGRVDRSKPKKPNSPWADIGDASAYLYAFLRPGSGYGEPNTAPRPTHARTATSNPYGDQRRVQLATSATGAW